MNGEMSFGASGTLVERLLARLADGSMTTESIAVEILALRGNPRVAAAAVFSLVGSDPRFIVDAQGVWSLAGSTHRSPERSSEESSELPFPDDSIGAIEPGIPDAPAVLRPRRPRPPGPLGPVPGAFSAINWVVVDVETTGGSPAHGDRVIEFAAVVVSGGRIVESFSSLVNPGKAIPYWITRITGIDDSHVVDAPGFDVIAPRVAELLGGRIFVGHNAKFDWGFVHSEMERATGKALLGRQFCTLNASRKLLPQLPSRSLGALADYFGIPMETHHRALDDATATAHLLLRFLDTLGEQGVEDWRSYERFLSGAKPKQPRRSARPTWIDRE